MASEKQLQSLRDEATCSMCLEYFTEPVSVECGHVFCLSCITQCWEGLQINFPCPQCRETALNKTIRPLRQLANMVEIAKELHAPRAAPQEENLCREHQEKLKLFCEDDQAPICVVCSMSRDHKAHTVLPIREAAQEYKGKFQSCLEKMKRKLENILGRQCKEETKVTNLEENFKRKTEQITSVFETVQQFLKNEEHRHLNNLQMKAKQSLQTIREKVTKLELQQALVLSRISKIELKCQQQDAELLKDVKNILSRYEHLNVRQPDSGPSRAKTEYTEETQYGEEKGREDLQLKIIESLEWRWASSFAVEVTLDPDTAHNRLIVSKDGRSVRHVGRVQNLPDRPERFTRYHLVLGRERLTSGRHYWEVEVGDTTDWTLGLCDECVTRKGEFTLSYKCGLWTVFLRDGKYKACTDQPNLLMPSTPPKVIGLFLDYEAGRISVYNLPDRSLLFTFSEAKFPRTLRPIFFPGKKDGRKNLGTLQILPLSRKN